MHVIHHLCIYFSKCFLVHVCAVERSTTLCPSLSTTLTRAEEGKLPGLAGTNHQRKVRCLKVLISTTHRILIVMLAASSWGIQKHFDRKYFARLILRIPKYYHGYHPPSWIHRLLVIYFLFFIKKKADHHDPPQAATMRARKAKRSQQCTDHFHDWMFHK